MTDAGEQGDGGYDERLVAPPAVWAGALALAVLVAATLHSGAPGWRAVVPYVVAPLVAVVVVAAMSRGRIRVRDRVLHVPGARIELQHLGPALALDREGTRRVRGPLAQPRAFLATRPWLAGSVRVPVEDPEDDTPYWLVGTRHPDRLAQVLGGR